MSIMRTNGYYFMDVEHDPGLTQYGPAIALPSSIASAKCGWLIGDDVKECGKPATRGTNITGPLCDEHGEEHDRETNR